MTIAVLYFRPSEHSPSGAPIAPRIPFPEVIHVAEIVASVLPTPGLPCLLPLRIHPRLHLHRVRRHRDCTAPIRQPEPRRLSLYSVDCGLSGELLRHHWWRGTLWLWNGV